MKSMTHSIREEIAIRKKNNLDISDLIEDVDIKNEDLSHNIIHKIRRIDSDISNCNFSYCIFGRDHQLVEFIRCKMNNCNFEGAVFSTFSQIRSCNAQGCNFKKADVHKVHYENSDFRSSNFCGAIITIETCRGIGAIFPIEMFQELCKGWKMNLRAEYRKEEV